MGCCECDRAIRHRHLALVFPTLIFAATLTRAQDNYEIQVYGSDLVDPQHTHHRIVAACGMACGQGSSAAADMETRRAARCRRNSGREAVVAWGWFVCAVAAGADESRVELRLREGDDERRTSAAHPSGDRRVHAGVFGTESGEAFGEFVGDRNLGGCDVGARDTRAYSFGLTGWSSLPRGCESGRGK
jgi:hypothetical protein